MRTPAELDKDRARAILSNWRRWAKDDPPDPASVYYYTICPDFRGVVKHNSPPSPYNVDAAELVEDVFRSMFVPYGSERDLLVKFYLRDCNATDFAELYGISRRMLYYRLDFAIKVFIEMWQDRGGNRFLVA